MEYSIAQRKIIENRSKYVQVIAAAGSGKTKTMIGNIVHNLQTQKNIENRMLVVTFSKKATNEIRERLETEIGKSKIKIATFHSYCFQTLKQFDETFQKKSFQVISEEQKNSFFIQFFQKHKYEVGGVPFEILNNERILKEKFPLLRLSLQKEFQIFKMENSLLEFDDMIHFYIEAFEKGKKWTKKAQEQVKKIIVDEFQDTNETQLKLLQFLNPSNLTVVGDDWQAIYGFRGASVTPFLQFQHIFAPCDVNYLTTNYRSLSSIIKVSSKVIQKNKNNLSKKIEPFRKNKKGWVKKFEIEEVSEVWDFVKKHISKEEEYKILCRSNYRISEYVSVGFSYDNLITIHGSKGLEFETVLVDLCDGWYMKAKQPLETLEEERRILYVALSRAKDNLYIIGSKEKPEKKRIEDLFYSYFKWNVSYIR